MKTFVTISVVAILAIAIAFINVSQSNAQRCSDRPPVNTTEVKCDQRGRRPAQALQNLACLLRCRSCYQSGELQRLAGCLVDGKCQCLGQENSNTTSTTTTNSDEKIPSDITDSSDTADSTDAEITDTESDRELTSPSPQDSNDDDESNDEETAITEDSDPINDDDIDDTETDTTTTTQ